MSSRCIHLPIVSSDVPANQDHLAKLREDVDVWNEWRREHTDIQPHLSEANLSKADLSKANLFSAHLNEAYCSELPRRM